MSEYTKQRAELMAEAKEQLVQLQGLLCGVPGCGMPWTDVAHIWGSGSGGRLSTYTVDNLVGLCRPCHDAYDGRVLQARQLLLRRLMAAVVREGRKARRKGATVGF